MPEWALATILGVAGTAAVTALGSIVWLLWDLKALTVAQNGTLATVVREFATHRQEDRQDFDKVHSRIDDVLALLP